MSGAVLTLLGSGGAASAVTIDLSPQLKFAINFGSPASAEYILNTNGNVEYSENGVAASVLEAWCIPAAQATNYESFATLVSGSLSGGTLGSWLALSSTRSWEITQSSPGVTSAIFNVGIRRVGTTTILASADIELNAEYS
jgi:hypothetical protein